MATCKKNYDDLHNFTKTFPRDVKKKKDLIKLKPEQLLKLTTYQTYFRIDKRLSIENQLKELKRYKETNLRFKSEELGINLSKNTNFDIHDKYKSSNKLISKVTDAMLGMGEKLYEIDERYEKVDVAYKKTVNRKVIVFKKQHKLDFSFMEYLPENIYVNIRNAKSDKGSKKYNSSYNKNGLDFAYDYYNSSNDFANQLTPLIGEDYALRIYKYN